MVRRDAVVSPDAAHLGPGHSRGDRRGLPRGQPVRIRTRSNSDRGRTPGARRLDCQRPIPRCHRVVNNLILSAGCGKGAWRRMPRSVWPTATVVFSRDRQACLAAAHAAGPGPVASAADFTRGRPALPGPPPAGPGPPHLDIFGCRTRIPVGFQIIVAAGSSVRPGNARIRWSAMWPRAVCAGCKSDILKKRVLFASCIWSGIPIPKQTACLCMLQAIMSPYSYVCLCLSA